MMSDLSCEIYDEMQDENTFHVMWVEFPSDTVKQGVKYLSCKNKFGLLSVHMTTRGFQFLSLNAKQYTAVNDAMKINTCELNKWYFCNVYKTEEENKDVT